MKWGSQQQAALAKAKRWFEQESSSKQVFKLFGYAGTGKTELAKEIASWAKNPMFLAFTGKAASVMQQRGCEGATTIHSLIYNPKQKGEKLLKELRKKLAELDPESEEASKLRWQASREEESLKKPGFILNVESKIQHADLVIVDEGSMVGQQVAKDLLSFEVPTLVLGDPAQLPPVKDISMFAEDPDFMLTEIHRQAAGSPVIQLATLVRQGKSLDVGEYGSSAVVWGKPDPKEVLDADQVIVGKNATRRVVNSRMRRLLGREEPLPETGDRVICLRNDHEVGLLNGTIWTAGEVTQGEQYLDMCISDGNSEISVEAHPEYFLGTEKDIPYWDVREAQCFDFAYAITAHKAQGSQWGNVLIFDESYVFRYDAAKWLYTAITRAEDRVTIVRS